MIRAHLICAVVALAALAGACGGGGKATATGPAVQLAPGQVTTATVTVNANTIGTEALSSCDSVQITGVRNISTGANEQLGTNLSAGVTTSPTKSGGECSAAVTITAAANAIPDNYEVDLQFNYTLLDSLDGSVRTDETAAAISVEVTPS